MIRCLDAYDPRYKESVILVRNVGHFEVYGVFSRDRRACPASDKSTLRDWNEAADAAADGQPGDS